MSKLQPADFVHLHNHTQYSLLDGLTKVPNLIEYVKMNGMEAVAITDHGTLSGAVEFYKAAKQDDINPVIGMETYVAARKHTSSGRSSNTDATQSNIPTPKVAPTNAPMPCMNPRTKLSHNIRLVDKKPDSYTNARLFAARSASMFRMLLFAGFGF